MLTHDFKSNTVFSDNISSNMDSSRHCVRRGVIPHKEAEFSSQSIMKTMEKFVQAVQDMDETILVPSRLLDLRVGDESDTTSIGQGEAAGGGAGKRVGGGGEGMASTDLYELYTMVNCVKNELLWGGSEPAPQAAAVGGAAEGGGGGAKTHARRPSTASVASTNSAALSDTDSEAGNENDSGVETESDAAPKAQPPSYTRTVEEAFRRHLYGLHRSLEQMTRAASYLTERYQRDVGAGV